MKNLINVCGYKKGILPSIEGSAVEISLILRDRDELVDQGFLLNEVVCPLIIIGVLQLVSLLPIERLKMINSILIKCNLTGRLSWLTFQTVDLMKMRIWSNLISRFPPFSLITSKSSIRMPTCCPKSDNLIFFFILNEKKILLDKF